MVELQAACFRHAKAVAEHQKEKATVTSLIAAALGRLDEALYREGGKVLALAVVERGIARRAPPATPRPASVPGPSWRVGFACKFGNMGQGV